MSGHCTGPGRTSSALIGNTYSAQTWGIGYKCLQATNDSTQVGEVRHGVKGVSFIANISDHNVCGWYKRRDRVGE